MKGITQVVLPIAGLDYAGHDCRGMSEYDLLCLDYGARGEPAAVVWPFSDSSLP